MLKVINLEATTLSDAWFQLLFKIIEKGRIFIIDRGSFKKQKRLEFDWVTIHIKKPWLELLPHINPILNLPDPVDQDYINDYLPYLMTGEEKKGESYTYGQRICRAEKSEYMKTEDLLKYKDILIQEKDIWENKNIIYGNFINQMELMIWTYKNKGYRNNQMCLQIAQPNDILLKDPPCLRLIDTRIQDGYLNFYPYFRSWDLWGGFPANLAGIELMKQYCAEQIGAKNGEIIASSKGMHIYDYVFELAEIVRGKSINEFKKEIKNI